MPIPSGYVGIDGAKLRRLRKSMGLSRRAISEAAFHDARLRLTHAQLTRIESQDGGLRTHPTRHCVKPLAEWLEEFFGDSLIMEDERE
jgi:hypothetical protein